MSQAESQITPTLYRLQLPALAVGLIGIIWSAIGFVSNPDQFFRSYLVAFIFWTGIPIGCLIILMIQYLSGGQWGLIIRRPLEAGTKTLPLMAVFFIPLIFGIKKIFLWAQPDKVATDAILQAKVKYLNVDFFVTRAGIYFLLWIGFAFLLNKLARMQDERKNTSLSNYIQNFSGLGLVVLALTLTLAGTDWIMSLEPHWYSTMLSVIWIAGNILIAMAFIIIVVAQLTSIEPFLSVVRKRHTHDLGNLMLAFVMFWAYCSFSQFLITWSGNLREETPWYLKRMNGNWSWVAVTLLVLHFFLPFFLLLSKDLKRNGKKLIFVAILVIFMRFVDLYWWISPSFLHGSMTEAIGPHLHWLDIHTVLGLGGIWFAVYIWQVKSKPLLPIFDIQLEELYHAE